MHLKPPGSGRYMEIWCHVMSTNSGRPPKLPAHLLSVVAVKQTCEQEANSKDAGLDLSPKMMYKCAPSQKNETNQCSGTSFGKTFKISQNDTYVIWLKKQKNTQKSWIVATPSLSELSPRGVFFYAPHQCGRCQGCWESPRRQRHIGPSPDLQVMRGNSGHKALEILRKKSGETKSSSAKSQLDMDYLLKDIDGLEWWKINGYKLNIS